MKKVAFYACVVVLVLSSCKGGFSPKDVKLTNEADTASYYIGYSIGQQLFSSGISDIKNEAVVKGMQDAFDEVELSMAEMQLFMQEYFTKMQERQSEESLAAGKTFLESNKTKSGVVTLPDGLQYKVIKEGSGIKPGLEDEVDVIYHGTLVDGTVFDSTKERGDTALFAVNGMIPGFTEALMLMNEGSIWEVYIPSDLAYGPQGRGAIKPNSVLIFELNMVKVHKSE